MTPAQLDLQALKHSLADTQPVGVLVECAKTLDQVYVWVHVCVCVGGRMCICVGLYVCVGVWVGVYCVCMCVCVLCVCVCVCEGLSVLWGWFSKTCNRYVGGGRAGEHYIGY